MTPDDDPHLLVFTSFSSNGFSDLQLMSWIQQNWSVMTSVIGFQKTVTSILPALSLFSLLTVKKILEPTTDFPTWGSGKGTKTLREFDLEASGIWSQDWHRNGETDSMRAQKSSCVHWDPGERSRDPRREWPRLACECPGVTSGGVGWRWPAAGLKWSEVNTPSCVRLFVTSWTVA